MARFTGIQPGFVPVGAPTRRAPAEKREVAAASCPHCGGTIETRRRKLVAIDDACRHCAVFFGLGDYHWPGTYGATSDDPETAAAKIAAIRESGWMMVLRRIALGGVCEFEPGDVFRPTRVGDEAQRAADNVCSAARTKALHSVGLTLAGTEFTFFTHEVSAISFHTLMGLKNSGELVECFVSAEDTDGHFAPSPELRAEIYATFGNLVNA